MLAGEARKVLQAMGVLAACCAGAWAWTRGRLRGESRKQGPTSIG